MDKGENSKSGLCSHNKQIEKEHANTYTHVHAYTRYSATASIQLTFSVRWRQHNEKTQRDLHLCSGGKMAEHSIIFSDKQMKVRGNVSPTDWNSECRVPFTHRHHHSMEIYTSTGYNTVKINLTCSSKEYMIINQTQHSRRISNPHTGKMTTWS